MGRSPCCSKEGTNRGAWTVLEDTILIDYIKAHGEGGWRSLPNKAGLKRCGKSCRLRWLNYLRPDIKRGNISRDEEDLIIRLHKLLGNRWALIAGRLPGRTDNEIKNYWNTNLLKKVQKHSKGKSKSSANLSMVNACHNLVPENVNPNDSFINGETRVEDQAPMHRHISFEDLVNYGNSTIDTLDDPMSENLTMGSLQFADLLNFDTSGTCDVNNNIICNNNGTPPMPPPSSDHISHLMFSNEMLEDWSLYDQNVASSLVSLSSLLESEEDWL